jgi:hypothetical protein
MKKKLPENNKVKFRRAMLPVVFIFSSLISYAGGSLPEHTGRSFPYSNTVMITSNLNNRKHKVKLFTASDYKTLLFTVDGVEGKRYTLFVFDLDGTLIIQSVIQNRETSVLPEINSGAYLYEVLVDDTKVAAGQLKIK